MSRGAVARRLAGFYAAYFGTTGVWLPFWPVWLASRGLDAAAIGTVLAAGSWVRLIAGPTAARIADSRPSRRPVMVALALAGTAFFALFPLVDGFWPVLLLSVAIFALMPSVLPLAETLTLQGARRHGLDYGRLRLWGSVAFIATSVGAGWWLIGRSEAWIHAMLLAGYGLVAVACLTMPEAAAERRTGPASGPSVRLLADRRFLAFLVAGACGQASHAVYYGFGTLHWHANGLDNGLIGILWAEGVVAEVALFWWSGALLRRLGPAGLLALGTAAGVLRWALTAATVDPLHLVALQLLHALTFGATHLGAMHFLARAVPGPLAATAQATYTTASSGIAMGLAMPASGIAYAAFGGGAFLLAAAISAAGLVLALALGRLWDGRALDGSAAG